MSSKSKKNETKTRTIFVKDEEKTVTGFKTHEEATLVADKMGPRDNAQRRVRVSYRRRTSTYDVVVKLAREVEDSTASKTE